MIIGLGTVERDGPVEQVDGCLETAVLQGEHPQQEHDIGVVVTVRCIEPGISITRVRTGARRPRADHQDIRAFRHDRTLERSSMIDSGRSFRLSSLTWPWNRAEAWPTFVPVLPGSSYLGRFLL